MVDWIGVSALRAAEVVSIPWLLLGIAAYQNWGGGQELSNFIMPFSWISLLAFAFLLAARRYELSDEFK